MMIEIENIVVDYLEGLSKLSNPIMVSINRDLDALSLEAPMFGSKSLSRNLGM
jgi:hypothetical protein